MTVMVNFVSFIPDSCDGGVFYCLFPQVFVDNELVQAKIALQSYCCFIFVFNFSLTVHSIDHYKKGKDPTLL